MVAGNAPALGHMRWLQALQNIFASAGSTQESGQPMEPRAPVSRAVAEIRTGGDCGPDSAAWLLNEHGPPLYRAQPQQTPASVRLRLQQAWITWLRGQPDDDLRAFVQQRLEQVPKAAEAACLDVQVELILQGILCGELDEAGASETNGVGDTHSEGPGDTGGSPSRPPPYWFLPVDWARLSEAYQVDFVIHGLPGTLPKHCPDCGTNGHIHTGPRQPGMDLCLHVGWCAIESSNWGHWEPLGAGPIMPPDAVRASSNPEIPVPLPDPGDPGESRRSVDGSQLCVKVFANFPSCKNDSTTCKTGIAGIAASTCAGTASFTCRRSPCVGEDCCPACPPHRDTIKVEDADASFLKGAEVGCSGPIEGDRIPPEFQEPPTVSPVAGNQSAFPSTSSGHGVRICFLFDGPELPKEQSVRDEVARCIATALTICNKRVWIADAGPPLAWRPTPQRRRNQPPQLPERAADTGAGVLPLLEPDSGNNSGAEMEPELTPEAPVSVLQEDANRESRGTRVLIAIREPPPSKHGSVEEEVSAMQALEILLATIEDPESQLQKDLQRLSNGCRVKLWGSAAPSARSRLESRYGCRDLRGGRSPKALGLHTRAAWRRSPPVAVTQ